MRDACTCTCPRVTPPRSGRSTTPARGDLKSCAVPAITRRGRRRWEGAVDGPNGGTIRWIVRRSSCLVHSWCKKAGSRATPQAARQCPHSVPRHEAARRAAPATRSSLPPLAFPSFVPQWPERDALRGRAASDNRRPAPSGEILSRSLGLSHRVHVRGGASLCGASGDDSECRHRHGPGRQRRAFV
ncbi:hypothetical protein PYCCODRAFT_1084502 [Trametes coccinea BRFM310]|uniref:Uncharacterized protein n=1 Tax=Trametes coccinea (strain BRFM310) TaxID=1353009 RepID=A0A1Y2IYI4_TRAC3|nr:hypothetical protein PYCCODRAFT_1084502 [Trametes coccinea BRFM310]